VLDDHEVFGGRSGTFAEYVSIPEDGVVLAKPANLTFVLGGPSRRIEQLGYFSM